MVHVLADFQIVGIIQNQAGRIGAVDSQIAVVQQLDLAVAFIPILLANDVDIAVVKDQAVVQYAAHPDHMHGVIVAPVIPVVIGLDIEIAVGAVKTDKIIDFFLGRDLGKESAVFAVEVDGFAVLREKIQPFLRVNTQRVV